MMFAFERYEKKKPVKTKADSILILSLEISSMYDLWRCIFLVYLKVNIDIKTVKEMFEHVTLIPIVTQLQCARLNLIDSCGL